MATVWLLCAAILFGEFIETCYNSQHKVEYWDIPSGHFSTENYIMGKRQWTKNLHSLDCDLVPQ